MNGRSISVMLGLLLVLGIFSGFLSNFTVRTVVAIDKFSNERAIMCLLESAKVGVPNDTPPLTVDLKNQPRVKPYYNSTKGKMVLPIGEIFTVDTTSKQLKFNTLFNFSDAVKPTGKTIDIFYSTHLHQNVTLKLSSFAYDFIRDIRYANKVKLILDKDSVEFLGSEE